ncbi:putative arabinosyltransferase ARAD1 [Bidens hawaiensis]|uniref:putative arabinosyltransferase ARAD1 n=1 Tax=Bidens hawaiensis TaxID=980011 RepID=UPI004049AF98
MKMKMKGGKAVVIFLVTVLLIAYYSITNNNNNNTGFSDLKLSSQLSFFALPKFTTPPSPSPSPAAACRSPPLRVFMYDLPNRFNVGMLNHNTTTYHRDDSSPLNVENLPVWPYHPQLQQQHSVEYWMTASLLRVLDDDDDEPVRVFDPEAADVFFVPFFSSLSFNTHGRNMTDPDTQFDQQLQVDMLEFLRKSDYWQRTSGRDHVIPMHHPNAFRFLREQVNASILIVADFGRFPKSMSTLQKDVVAPYKHVVESFLDDGDDSSNPYKLRTTLLFFRGRTVRKAEGKVRRKLEKILQGYDDVHFEASYATGEGINASTQGMRSSKFCLHPAGDTPSSNRLFDAIVSHCVPVIISDHIELPFESELDYSKFSLFFSVNDALVPGYMVEHLRKIPENEWLLMWARLKEIAHHFEYQFPPKKDDAVNMIWRQVRSKVPAERLAVNRNRRLTIPDWW